MRRTHVASTLIRRHFRTKCPLGYAREMRSVLGFHLAGIQARGKPTHLCYRDDSLSKDFQTYMYSYIRCFSRKLSKIKKMKILTINTVKNTIIHTSLQTSMVPNTICNPSKKLSPIIITVVPPVVQPSLGQMAFIQGVAETRKKRTLATC